MTRSELAFPSGNYRCTPEETQVRERLEEDGRSTRALVYANLGSVGNPAIHDCAFGTGGFASPSFDGFAKTSARSVRRQTESTHLYLLGYCRC